MNNDSKMDSSLASITAEDDDTKASVNIPFETHPLNNQGNLRKEKTDKKKKDDDDNWQGPVELH